MHEVRKTVTILFADVVSSTRLGERLDVEALRSVVTRYFSEMADVVTAHGGTVEKFIGDEVMAVFGVPTAHEDDALRAVRAAVAMHERLRELNRELSERWRAQLEIRIGVNTGEVVAGDPSSGHGFVSGDAVNLAKRLQQATPPGETFIGEGTARLVSHAVLTEALEPQEMKGKEGAVIAHRVLTVDPSPEPAPRRFDVPLVGRSTELGALRFAYARAVETRRPQLMTVVGVAGIGKSRLVRELLDEVEDEAEVLVGRCLPYGEGITFWPVRDILPSLPLEGTTEEIFRRVRVALEEIAAVRPVVVCFEDLHWAEPTFLDLVQYLAGWIRDAPVVLLCLTRPDLLERRPDWTTTGADTLSVRLSRLGDEEVSALLEHLGAATELSRRIASASEGNPFFLEQMAAMAAEEGGVVSVPPSIRALLTARLDRLDPTEMVVLECAAVVGREFPLRAVIDLAPPDVQEDVASHLLALVRKEFVRPHSGEDDRFTFRHALIRDAVYEAIPKAVRAELHARHARWLEAHGRTDAIVGYHLEQTVLLRRELAEDDAATTDLAARAGELLGEAGRTAFRRADMSAARSLLRRSLALLPAGHAQELAYLRDLANAMWALGEIEPADELLQDVVERASRAGDRALEWYARLDRAQRLSQSGQVLAEEFVGTAEAAIEAFEELHDQPGIARARRGLAIAAFREGAYGRAAEEIERAIAYTDPNADRNADARNADVLASALLYGPVEAASAARRCRRLLERGSENPELEAHVSSSLAGLEAMLERFGEARERYAHARALYEDLGLRMPLVGLTQISGAVELLAGDPVSAERELRGGYESLLEMGATGYLSPQAALLALALLEQGRDEEAEQLVVRAEQATTADVPAGILVRTCRSLVALDRGQAALALEASEAAVDLARRTDALNLIADAHVALGRACALVGLHDRAVEALARARELYEEKGNAAGLRRLGVLVTKVTT